MKTPSPTGPSVFFFAIIAVAAAHLADGHRCSMAQEPAKSRDVLLKDFVDNCIAIKPGTDQFPQQFPLGRHSVRPFALPDRLVVMSHPFRISKYETTQELFEAILGRNPSRWKGPRNSVESMSFLDATAFCSKLTVQLRAAKLIAPNESVRLPTEAEWEYCCRAGTDTLYSFGESASVPTDRDPVASILNDYAWHTGNAAGNDPAVGVLKPNPWGLFDMHGYLWEYVSDQYNAGDSPDDESAAPGTEGAGASMRIVRGGSWRDHASQLTSGARMPIPDHVSSDAIGFRCVIAREPQP